MKKMILKSVFGRMFFSVAFCLLCLFASSDAICAEGKDVSNPKKQNSSSEESVPRMVSVVFAGEIDGEGTFIFQGSKVIYRHSQFDEPRKITINGKQWNDLKTPFELGFTPDYATTQTDEKSGRNTIRVTSFPDRAELYIFDTASSSSQYRVKMSFQMQSSSKTPVAGQDIQIAEEEDENRNKLRGVFYDLKRTSDGMSTYLLELQEGKQFNRLRTWQLVWNLPDTAGKESVMVPFLKRFVLSNWPCRTDSSGDYFYREFSKFFRSTVTPYQSYFYQPVLPSDSAPKTVSADPAVSDIGWVAIHSGYVVAPFTGKFRFVGYGNDALVVRFDKQLVLDYGAYALSLGKKLDDTWDYYSILSGNAARTDPQKRPVLDNPIYSRCKLEIYFSTLFDKHGLAKGVPVSVKKGQFYPIEVLFSDIERNGFCMALFVERLNSDGTPLNNEPERLPLFRTSSDLPNHGGGSFPDFDENSPIWMVVDSNGKPISSRTLNAGSGTKNDTPAEKAPQKKPETGIGTKKKDSGASSATETTTQRKTSSSQQNNESKPKKTVSSSKQGNVTSQTVTEKDGDTIIETVTTTEVDGDTTIQTTIVTEKKNGAVVKKTTSTSKSVVVEMFPDTDSSAEKKKDSPKTEKSESTQDSASSSSKPGPSEEKTDSSTTA